MTDIYALEFESFLVCGCGRIDGSSVETAHLLNLAASTPPIHVAPRIAE